MYRFMVKTSFRLVHSEIYWMSNFNKLEKKKIHHFFGYFFSYDLVNKQFKIIDSSLFTEKKFYFFSKSFDKKRFEKKPQKFL